MNVTGFELGSYHLPNAIGLMQAANQNDPVITKSPFYVLGETFLRPTIRAGVNLFTHFYSSTQKSLSVLDEKISSFFQFIPKICAQNNDQANNQMIVWQKFKPSKHDIATAKMLTKIGGSNSPLLNLSPTVTREQKEILRASKTISTNYFKFLALLGELESNFVDEGIRFNDFKLHISNYCHNLMAIESILTDIRGDLSVYNQESTYAPSHEKRRKIHVLLPRINGLDSITLGAIMGTEGNPTPSNNQDDWYHNECQVNDDLKEYLLAYLEQTSGIFALFTSDSFTFDDINAFYSDQTVINFEKIIRNFISNLASNANEIMNSILREKKQKSTAKINNIYAVTANIYKHHERLASTKSFKIIHRLNNVRLTPDSWSITDGAIISYCLS